MQILQEMPEAEVLEGTEPVTVLQEEILLQKVPCLFRLITTQ